MRESSNNIVKKKVILSVNTRDASILTQKLNSMKIESLEDLQEEQKDIMSEILPYLFLGSENIPLNSISELKKRGITHVLNMAEELQIKSPARTQEGISFSNFPLRDIPDEDLIPTLRQVSDYIRIFQIQNILVKCDFIF